MRFVATFLIVILSLSDVAHAQISDTTPPQLTAFTVSQTAVDVTAGDQTISWSATLTDDLAGPSWILLEISSPTGSQYHQGLLTSVSSPSPLQLVFDGTLTVPQYVLDGTWTFTATVADNTGNSASLGAAELAAAGFQSTLDVTSIPDTMPPVVTDLSPMPNVVDTTAGDAVVTIDLRIQDNVSGFDFSTDYYFTYLSTETWPYQQYAIPRPDISQISGDDLDGVYRINWNIPQFSKAGPWQLYVHARDKAGNRSYNPSATFDVISPIQDLSPPVLTGLSITPQLIDTSAGPASVTVRMTLTDDLSGVDVSLESPYGGYFHGLFAYSPSSSQSRTVCCDSFQLVSGTNLDGVWEGQMYFPQYSEDGTWTANVVFVTDHVRNGLWMSPTDLAAAGLQSTLVVVRPSLEGDGMADSTGGTITDDTFGSRAQLTFPAGILPGPTDVAIDVFPDPLAILTPEGFQGPGSYFVNFDLSPAPPQPFPIPGVSATLPLTDYLPPGTAIPLFYVDPTTGLLAPMESVYGGSVIGAVNADGLSVTFDGISHFTILVGLIPDTIQVAIDVKPESDDNPISVTSRGVTPVAILSSGLFDAPAVINRESLTFGATGTEASLRNCGAAAEDVNWDGLPDLLCFFYSELTGLMTDDTTAFLGGETLDGTPISGSDSVHVLQSKGVARGQTAARTPSANEWWQERQVMKCKAMEQQRDDNAKLPPGLGCSQ